MKFHHISEEEAQERARWNVPIEYAGQVTLYPGDPQFTQVVPLIQIDTSQRTEIRDLIRLIGQEGTISGQHPPPLYTGGNDPGIIIQYTFTDPAPCQFSLWLPWPKHDAFIEYAAANGAYVLATTDEQGMQYATYWRTASAEWQRALRLWRNKNAEHQMGAE